MTQRILTIQALCIFQGKFMLHKDDCSDFLPVRS